MADTYARQGETGLQSSGVLTSDTAVKAVAGKVYWVTISGDTTTKIQLNDSTDDSGTDKWSYRVQANGNAHIIFDPPLEFSTGIYLDMPAGEAETIVGYI